MFKSLKSLLLIAAVAIAGVGCTRIETGEVGLRLNSSKIIEGTELMEGSWNQTLIGEVLTFPVRDLVLHVKNLHPLTRDNTPLKDLDFNLTYNLNAASVSELWSKKSRSWHTYDNDSKDWFLMHSYMNTIANNAAQKVIRKYDALKVTDSREAIEKEIHAEILVQLKIDAVDMHAHIAGVRVQSILPNDAIVNSAVEVVKAQNQLAVADAQVKIAQKEAERMAALSSKGSESIAYMNAQAQMKIAEGIAAGKVQTIIVPYDFKGIVNAGK